MNNILPFLAMIILLTACGGKSDQHDGDTHGDSRDAQAVNHAQHDDIGRFWTDFRQTALSDSREEMAALMHFPFLKHGAYLHQSDFPYFFFTDEQLAAVTDHSGPVKSSMFFGGGEDLYGELVEVDFPEADSDMHELDLGDEGILYFAKVDGRYRFIAVLYGE
jgi:hypothetical protein